MRVLDALRERAADLRERLNALLFRGREERALEEELRFHLEMETEANVRRGMAPAEARRRAAITLGGVERTKESVRDARGTRLLEDVARDAVQSVRSLGRTPAFTVTAVVVLALGIAATYLIGLLLWPFVPAIVTSAALAALVYPAHQRLEERVGHPDVAAFIGTTVLFFAILLPLVGLSFVLVGELRVAQQQAHQIAHRCLP